MKSYLRLCFVFSLLIIFSCTPEEKVADIFDYSSLSFIEMRMSTNAVAGLQTHPELETTLFASEPMVVNPTNIDIDERGRVWVTEGYNYRIQIHKNNPVKEGGDRIVILEDEDGDGRADTSKVFYQGEDINSALGILVLGNKVIVSCSPLVIMLTDTDGDDKADKKEILLTGIEGVQHDHGVHAFVFGPDGKLYFNFGNNGTRLLDKDGNPILDKATGAEINDSGKPFREGMIFRSDRDGSNIEVLAHNFRNNYEVAVDSYGTLWQSDNDDDGNRGARINFVMEYGNYGYKDEMTGAGWRAPRTGMHDSIPLRHWHQNDPGSMPNLLQTGAGSPTGMVVYEGNLLPGVFQGQMIHSEPGQNVVRSYPVQEDGAGYKAKIVNILNGVNDQWFRPSDVCIAPDGSLMVADWYDPGVGGHGVGDLNRGRIYRVAPKGSKYEFDKISITSAKDAAEALKSPNMARRSTAWLALEQMGDQAEDELVKLWNSSNPIFQARALWLLSILDGKGQEYIEQALGNENPDLRITAIRVARNQSNDIKPLLKRLINDPSAQVRREIAVALRNDSSAEAEDLWVDLAVQHTGEDRWYLEALGIGATNKSEAMYQKWLTKVGNDWNNKVGRDIIWRLRDDQVLDKLSSLIINSPEDWKDKLRYFRAFDFHTPEKSNLELLRLIKKENANKDQITMTALFHLTEDFMANNLEIKGLLSAVLKNYRGTPEYISLVSKFKLKSEYGDVFKIAIDSAANQTGVLACKLLVDLGQQEFIVSKMNESNSLILAIFWVAQI
jgi:putative membrane-bound dehydrogenase-like protein